MNRSAPAARAAGSTARRDVELFDGYLDPKRPHADAYDEMFAPDRTLRPACRRLYEPLAPSAPAELTDRLAGPQETVREVGEAVAPQCFHSVPWVAWTSAGVSL